MASLPKDSPSPSPPTHPSLLKRKVELADAAVMLLPGLQQSRLLLDTAIRVLSEFAPPPPQGSPSHAEVVARHQRTLAEFGHPSVRR